MIRRWEGGSITWLICALAMIVKVGLLIPSSATALEHPFIETFGSANEPSFEEAQGMAVDQASGDLLVLDRDAGTLSRWHSDGTRSNFSALGSNVIGGFDFGPGTEQDPGEAQVAIDSSCALHEPPLTELTTPSCEEFDPADGNIYVATRGENAIDILDEDGNPLGQLTEYNDGIAKTFAIPCGVAVDPSGNVYVGEIFTGVHKYEPAANPPVNSDNVANFPFALNCNIAAGAGPVEGFIFPAQLEGKISKLDSSTGAEKYEVDAGPTASAAVDPSTGILYTASGREVKEYDVSGPTEAIPGVPIAPGGERVQGVAVDAATGRIYVSRKGNPNIEVWGKAVELPAAITESASVIGDAVTMRGVVNANEGPETTCAFEYVEVSAEGFNGATVVPCSPAGPFTGKANEAVSGEDSGLAEGTYRFRLVASNEDGSKAGETLFFNILAPVSLPDRRAYEMVSPPEKVGEVIPPEPVGRLGGSCSDCLPGGNEPIMPMQSNPDGSSVLYLGQPFTSGLASGPNEYLAPRSSSGWGTQSLSLPTTTGRYVAFSADLTRGVLSQANPPLSPLAPIRGGEGGGFPNLYLRQRGVFEPLITTEPPNRDPGNFRVSFGGANVGSALAPAFENVAFEANDALTGLVPTAPAAPEVEAGKECGLPGANCNLYEWEAGELRLINVLPNNSAAAARATIGSGRLLVFGIPQTQFPTNIDNAISDDGSRIFWSSEQTGQVYVRVDGKETLEIPGPGSCKEIVPRDERACFQTASPDGSTVLLSDGKVYELNGNAYVESVDLTETKGGFEGILGTSEDLSRIYFVDTAVLTAESEENENGEHAEEDELNLYAFDEGELDFIGGLLPGDNGIGAPSYGAWNASPSQRTAQVTRDGGHLAFMSLASLTGYDNTRSGGGKCRSSQTPACREVFIYAADSESLTCASCNPSGEQPLGSSNLSLILPDRPFRQPGNLSREGNGRLFFESLDALVPRDVNASTQDVYEWEPNGVGSCKRAQGCVSLISSGQSPNDSMFVDSSDSGNDAFFITREKLLPRDKNDQLDLYDARVGGGFEEAAPAPCSPEACAGPIASPPAQPSAASNEVTGPGNPKPKRCKPGFVKKQGKCVKKKPKKKKKAADNRRGSR